MAEAKNPDSAISKIDGRAALEAWLKGKPVDWAQAIATRAALRVTPLVFEPVSGADKSPHFYRRLVLGAFRANFISWAALKYPSDGLRVLAARAAARGAARAANNTYATNAAKAAYAAANAAEATYVTYGNSAPAARAAVNAADAAHGARFTVWNAVQADLRWLTAHSGSELIEQPLWLMDVRGDQNYSVNFPPWAQSPQTAFWESDLCQRGPWGIWVQWYLEIIPNGQGKQPKSLFGKRVDIEFATKPPEYWERDPDEVMADIAEIVGWRSPRSRKPIADGKPDMSLKDFILNLLVSEPSPFPLSEIYAEVEAVGYDATRDSIRGRVNELTYEGRIRRIGRALYASLNYDPSVETPSPERSVSAPEEPFDNRPISGPLNPPVDERDLPEATPRGIAFSEDPERPIDTVPVAGQSGRDFQGDLLEELQAKARGLAAACPPESNFLATLLGDAEGYSEAVSEDLSNLRIHIVWSRGNRLRRRLDADRRARSSLDPDSPPLPEEVGGALQDLVETHNVFIAGDVVGLELDQSSLGPRRPTAQSAIDADERVLASVSGRRDFLTEGAEDSWDEVIESALSARVADSLDAEQAEAVAEATGQNFLVASLRTVFHGAKWMSAMVIGGGVLGPVTYQVLGQTIAANAPLWRAAVAAHGDYPALQQLIDWIVKVFGA